MFECRLDNGAPMKKIISALKELIDFAAWDLSEEGIMLQSMDSSHVALVQLHLIGDNFNKFRCEDVFRLGLNMENLKKIFGAYTGGAIHINCDAEPDSVNFIFQDEKNCKSQKYQLRLMDLDIEQLGIPEQEYQATFTMSSAEFSKIIKDMLIVGESVTIAVTKGDVTFRTEGELGKAAVTVTCDESLDSVAKPKKKSKKNEKSSKKNKAKKEIKKEAGDSDDNMDSTLASADDEDETESKDKKEEENDEPKLMLDVKEHLELSFATAYLKKFTAAGPLAKYVTVALSGDVPMVITYDIEELGHLKYFLAPKIDDDEDDYD